MGSDTEQANSPIPDPDTLVIGAGPSGLSAAYLLSEAGRKVAVLEQDPKYVGGLSRTVEHQGYRFDIGGHRFFTKSAEVQSFWHEMLGSEFVKRKRLSRIFFRGRFFKYPLNVLEAFAKLGPFFSLQCLVSYCVAKIRPRNPVRSFEDWIVNFFGEKLYLTFFKAYTEKVWGIPCNQISSDWAAQRIKGLSFWSLIKTSVVPTALRRRGKTIIKTLGDSFEYPRLGPGQMWEKVAEKIEQRGGVIVQGASISRIEHSKNDGIRVIATMSDGQERIFTAKNLVSSMPIRSLIECMSPAAPDNVLEAARSLEYRDFLMVGLIVDSPALFPDNWLYIHEPDVRIGRIQNFKNWSMDLVADRSKTSLGAEYFCNENDDLWRMSDRELFEFAEKELRSLRLLKNAKVEDGIVLRVPKAYPVYDQNYKDHLTVIRLYLEKQAPQIQLAGRNGMHRYNNQDHAVMTGFVAARNVLAGRKAFDQWSVNQDAIYLEQASDESVDQGGRYSPTDLR